MRYFIDPSELDPSDNESEIRSMSMSNPCAQEWLFSDFVRETADRSGQLQAFARLKTQASSLREEMPDQPGNWRTLPNPAWPERESLRESLVMAILDRLRTEWLEVFLPRVQRRLLPAELEAALIDPFRAVLHLEGCEHRAVHVLSRKVDFEALFIRAFEAEAALTPVGSKTLDEIFRATVTAYNCPFAFRDATKKRIISLAQIPDGHRKRGPKPLKRRGD